MFQIAQFVDIRGYVDVDILRSAVARAIAETDSLNVHFGEHADGPYQEPRPSSCSLVVTDLTESGATTLFRWHTA